MRKSSSRSGKPSARAGRKPNATPRAAARRDTARRESDAIDAVTLEKSLLLRGTPPALTRELLAGCRRRDLDDGEPLLTQAQPNSTLYLLLRGQLHVLLGQSRDTAVPILPGECVGEMSVIDGSRVSAPVIAAEPSALLAVDVDRFWWLTERYPVIARNLLAVMAQRVRLTNSALTMRIRAHEREERLARVDTLTSAYNRRWLAENLPHYLERAQSAGTVLVVGIFDIDHFKNYNDSWGHVAGDDALRCISHAVREHIRPPDQLCRYGGEEFCLLLPDTSLAHAPKLAERVLETISTLTITAANGEICPPVTASLGFAASEPGDTSDSLLRRADRALYQAKHKGRNCFVLDASDAGAKAPA
jgi:diguanylate cyclase (GGDEF)-like protein